MDRTVSSSSFSLLTLVYVFAFATSQPQLSRSQTVDPLPSRGTINIFLGDQTHGVLATDSRGTHSDGSYDDLEQKLFKIDSNTAISIAGFLYDPGPILTVDDKNGYPLSVSIASMIEAFTTEESKQTKAITFDQKVSDLSWMIQYLLDNLNSEQRAIEGSRHSFPSDLEIMIVGYDFDNTLKCTKRTISYTQVSDSSATRPSGIVSRVEANVSDRLTYLVSGPLKAKIAVEDRIRRPRLRRYRSETELSIYRRAKRVHQTNGLTLEQLTLTVAHLKSVAEQNGMLPEYPKSVIGGPMQEAIFDAGQVSLISVQNRKSYPEIFAKNFISNSELNKTLLPLAMPSAVYVDTNCVGNGTLQGGKLLLRNTAFLSGRLDDCTFFFDGDPFYISNRIPIEGGTLVIGPGLCNQSRALGEARKRLPGIKEIWWSQYPLDQRFQMLLWNGGHGHCGPGDLVDDTK